jgi:hypothetical protein
MEFWSEVKRFAMWAGFVAAIMALALSFPISPLLILCAIAWLLVRRRKQVWAAPAAETLFSIGVGLALVCLSMIVFELGGAAMGAERIRAGENALITLHLWLEEAIHKLTFVVTVAILAVLAVMARFMPRLELVRRFGWASGMASNVSLALTVVLTFTFFSQKPLADLSATQYAGDISRLEILLRQDEKSVAQYLAAETISRALPLNETARRNIQATLWTIDQSTSRVKERSATGEILRRMVIGDVAEEDAKRMASDPEARVRSGEVAAGGAKPAILRRFSRKPESVGEYHEFQAAVSQEEERAESLKRVRDQEVDAVKQAFAAGLGALAPELKGIAGAYVERLVDACADRIFERAASLWRASAAPESALRDLAADAVPTREVASQMITDAVAPGETRDPRPAIEARVRRIIAAEGPALTRWERAAKPPGRTPDHEPGEEIERPKPVEHPAIP